MPKYIKTCRICGKEYEACRSSRKNDNIFRWQDVACSIECGMKYLEKIEKSRKKTTIESVKDSENIVFADDILTPIEDEDSWDESLDDDNQFGNTP